MAKEPAISLDVDHAARTVTTAWSGTFDLAAIVRSCQLRLEKGGHQYVQRIDARSAEIARTFKDSISISSVTARLANQMQKFGVAGPTAVVVSHQVDFGMCRMIAAYFEPAGEINVFYNMEEAERWLAGQAGF